MKDITIFINNELKPRLYDYIPQIFPELHFTRKGNKYVSNLHADGTEGSGHKEDRSVVTEKQPTKVFDNTRQEAKDIVTLYMEHNNITEVWEAVNKLCSIVGILPPENTPEGQERFRQAEQRRTALEASAERQRKALFAPEGKEVLEYLHSRGWTDNEIQEAELGYISTEEAATINAQRGIGDFYRLSIPLRDGTTIYGFKFRNIYTNESGKKYRYLQGTDKDNYLFNLTGIQQKDGAIVVVEGELDALHAKIRGVSGMVATGGGHLTEKLLDVATDRGIKRITLLFDKDERGASFVRNSIDIAHNRGISVLVATFPDGETLSDGTVIHDIDEYLQAHTPQELQSLLNNAVLGSRYLLENLINDAIKEHGEESLTDAAEIDLRNKVIDLANHTPSEVERDFVLSYYANFVNIDGKQIFSEASLRAVANRERGREELEKAEKKLSKTTKEIEKLLKEGNVKGALKMFKEASSRMKPAEDAEKFGDLLKVPSREELLRKYRDLPEALKTSYKFTEGKEDKKEKYLPFTLPVGALTILAAPTSHGKSAFLRNLAIDIARRYKAENNSVLYFTFEESEEDVIAQFTNTYIGLQLHSPSKRHTQVESIINYFKTGEPTFISEDKKEAFKWKEFEFSKEYVTSGKIRFYYKDYDLETLIEALEFAVSNIPTKAIFIDYIQILRSQQTKQPRTDQLKEVCISLKDFSVKHKIPVVLAAQLNREAVTPLRMTNTMMAESSDIEKAANTIVCLWNSKFKTKLGKKELPPEEKTEIEALEKIGFKMGTSGKIFAIITKKRGSRGVGMYAILNFEGFSGKILENYPEEEQKADEERDLKDDEEDNTPDIRLPFKDDEEDPF